MEDWLKQVQEQWNVTSDSAWYQSLRTQEVIDALAENPAAAFHPAVWALIGAYMPDCRGKRVLLPSSGDNHAALAFALMGAEVTSADISQRQLDNAAAIAERLGLDMTFVCDNTMTLSQLENSRFDLVFTSNGTHAWIPDVGEMYRNIHRVLKPGGCSVMYDVHPFNRPFAGEPWKAVTVVKSYHDTMPCCHWRMQDLLNAHIRAGLTIRQVEELPAVNASFWFSYDELIRQNQDSLEGVNDWRQNPMAALPAWVSIVAQKEGPEGKACLD